jgi:hypothetical protein
MKDGRAFIVLADSTIVSHFVTGRDSWRFAIQLRSSSISHRDDLLEASRFFVL